jgi:lipopolysaccharide transport system ATP-binding protein
MTKKEIDAKFDEIVEFAEMRQFIDTPVKRYSSGMYVKLAFSVAAHLDSEIMIMDEVLAVGDAKFQNKCLGKMSDEAGTGQRAILYVSHNMSTIQRLCTRVIVMDHGRIVYDGDTAGGVAKYLSVNRADVTRSDLRDLERNKLCRLKARMIEAWLPGKENNLYKQDDTMRFRLRWKTSEKLLNVVLRVYLRHMTAAPAGFATVPFGDVEAGQELESEISLNLHGIVPGSYYLGCEFHEIDSAGTAVWHDYIENMLQIEILENQAVKPGLPDHTSKIPWNHNAWGCLRLEAGMEDRT